MYWFRKAAEQGYAQAQASLGFMYANGQGVPRDDAEAIRWFRKAAEQGYPPAQFMIGRAHLFGGQGVPQDDAEAIRWFHKAAKQGYAMAQFLLGDMFADGQGAEISATHEIRGVAGTHPGPFDRKRTTIATSSA